MRALTLQSGIRCAAAAIVVWAGIAVAGVAYADDDSDVPNKQKCADGQATVIESKTCPPRPGRPAMLVKRACCTKMSEKGTKTRCKSFPHCPSHSPS